LNTFLPYSDFKKSASCLDNKRLGKQRVEAWQIYLSLIEEKYGWKNHPAVKMWRGYEISLLLYGIAICDEWISRGFKDTLKAKFEAELTIVIVAREGIKHPPFLGNEDFHKAMRSNLLRKDFSWYSKFGWTESNDLPYIWGIK